MFTFLIRSSIHQLLKFVQDTVFLLQARLSHNLSTPQALEYSRCPRTQTTRSNPGMARSTTSTTTLVRLPQSPQHLITSPLTIALESPKSLVCRLTYCRRPLARGQIPSLVRREQGLLRGERQAQDRCDRRQEH